mgnify:CR=1 FL=1|jgi:hypothetical protein|tara:strand:- start:1235 stop:1423 length:189 start_codon:yes stop_codon:yes gene_type:complete
MSKKSENSVTIHTSGGVDEVTIVFDGRKTTIDLSGYRKYDRNNLISRLQLWLNNGAVGYPNV